MLLILFGSILVLDGCLSDEAVDFVDTEAIVYADVSYASPFEGGQVCSAIECDAYVASQSSYVGAFAAHDPDGSQWRNEVEQLYLVYDKLFGLQFYLLPFASHLVGACPVYFAGREGGRHLLDRALEVSEGLFYQFARDVFVGVGGVYLCLQVV